MAREGKPKPDFFLLCQEKLRVERNDCLINGDAVGDIHAARRTQSSRSISHPTHGRREDHGRDTVETGQGAMARCGRQ